MNKKQKNLLIRIIISTIFFVPLFIILEGREHGFLVVDIPQWVIIIMFLIPYLLVGHDILRKAAMGIKNKQVFDESFLMTIATIGALFWDNMAKVLRLCSFTRLVSSFRVTPSVRAERISRTLWISGRIMPI